jgi:hypothetical protein
MLMPIGEPETNKLSSQSSSPSACCQSSVSPPSQNYHNFYVENLVSILRGTTKQVAVALDALCCVSFSFLAFSFLAFSCLASFCVRVICLRCSSTAKWLTVLLDVCFVRVISLLSGTTLVDLPLGFRQRITVSTNHWMCVCVGVSRELSEANKNYHEVVWVGLMDSCRWWLWECFCYYYLLCICVRKCYDVQTTTTSTV